MVDLPARRHTPPVTALERAAGVPLWTDEGAPAPHHHHFWGAAAVELASMASHPSAAAGRLVHPGPWVDHDGGRRRAIRLVRSLRAWQNAGSFEFRYLWRHEAGRFHLRLLLIARALGARRETARAWAEEMLRNATTCFPAGSTFVPSAPPTCHYADGWAEIERAEEVREPASSVPPGVASYYYLLHPLGGSGRAWPTLASALATAERPGCLSIVVMPTVMTFTERAAVDHVCSAARTLSAPWLTYDFFGNPTMMPADAAAADVHRAWSHLTDRTGVLARIGLATVDNDLPRLASLVGALLVDGADEVNDGRAGDFKVVLDLSDDEVAQTTEWGLVVPRRRHPVWSLPAAEAPVSLTRMPYFFSEQEAGGLLVMPALPGAPPS
jgi:hypothetical protein